MKVILAGSTGMIGNLLLNLCLHSEKIQEVVSLVRKPTGQKHPKLVERVIPDFSDYSSHQELFKNAEAAFFCLGVCTGQVADELFRKITVDYAVAFAETLAQAQPGASLCLLSGAGADRTEKSKTSFARYKGMAENRIAALNLKFYAFRPAYIYPVEARKEPNAAYKIMRFLYPVLKLLGKKVSIKSTELASALFQVGFNGADNQILENADILRYANR